MKTELKLSLVIVVLMAAAVSFSGCATAPAVQTKVAPGFNLARYHSFDVAPLQRQDGGHVRPEMESAVLKAIEDELGARNLHRVAGGSADLVVVVNGGIKPLLSPRYTTFSTVTGVPVVSGYSFEIDEQNEGTLTIFLFDARTKEELWQGTTTEQFITQKPAPSTVAAAVHEVLGELPKP